MNPAGTIRGRENMTPAYIGQPAGHEKGSATALSPPRSAMFSLKPVGRRTNSERFRSAPRTGRLLCGRLSVRWTDCTRLSSAGCHSQRRRKANGEEFPCST